MVSRAWHNEQSESHWLRSSIDLAICFVIAVMMLRAFVMEGYLISTGSMAPGLLGFHRRLACPECNYSFAYGVSFDESIGTGLQGIREPSGERSQVTCPNCGRNQIDITQVPNSHGDQLLVQKHVYDLRSPRRWETVVFRNPASPGEAYVKRVTGLPGESIRIADGDVFINQQIARKSLEDQFSCRIPICDLHHVATDESWQLPWELDEAWFADSGRLRCSGSRKETAENGDSASEFPVDDRQSSHEADRGVSWLKFRYWRWFGGKHISETPLSLEDAADFRSYEERFDSMPITWMTAIEYDDVRQVLRCRGVMTDTLQAGLLKHATREGFRNAVFRLAALSHLAPVTDFYGYNAMVDNPEFVVSDLMLSTRLEWEQTPSVIYVNVPLGAETYRVAMKPALRRIQLLSLDQQTIVAESEMDFEADFDGVVRLSLDVSNFDQQILIAVNGLPVMPPLIASDSKDPTDTFEYCLTTPTGEPVDAVTSMRISLRHEQQKRWALGVAHGDVMVSELQMYRDVFYTPGRRRHGIADEYQIPDGQYFVQGDNSPVSSDSRSWEQPTVPHELLLGKPFFVHLPSRPAVLEIGQSRWPIRVPDWRRIRYIR
ncbi:MAG: signal peptidase I [Planctomycetota bacterium]